MCTRVFVAQSLYLILQINMIQEVGWPSFYQPVNEEVIEQESDNTLGMRRTEVVCDACGAHLGHVFP